MSDSAGGSARLQQICKDVKARLLEVYVTVKVGQELTGFETICHSELLNQIEIADYTGPGDYGAFHNLTDVQLDVRAYGLNPDSISEARRRIDQSDEDNSSPARVLTLPNIALKEEWGSLVFDDGLPAKLLRCMVRMITMMTQPGINLSIFNLNRLCLLYGPSGSGKSTLCRALAQKISIRMNDSFTNCTLVEINANSMLSKYFGESGKLIKQTFDKVFQMAQSPSSLVCVVIDEVETIAVSRERAKSGTECNDGLRATNQLLTALDRLRNLRNVIILCTSNLMEAIDPAFLDRVDIKQFIPRPSLAATYNIFRSCLNELVRRKLIDTHPESTTPHTPSDDTSPPSTPQKRIRMTSRGETIPTFAEASVKQTLHPNSPGSRVLRLAHRCIGLSGRTLRRLPMLGLTMHTWGGNFGMVHAITALEAAVEAELRISNGVGEADTDTIALKG